MGGFFGASYTKSSSVILVIVGEYTGWARWPGISNTSRSLSKACSLL